MNIEPIQCNIVLNKVQKHHYRLQEEPLRETDVNTSRVGLIQVHSHCFNTLLATNHYRVMNHSNYETTLHDT